MYNSQNHRQVDSGRIMIYDSLPAKLRSYTTIISWTLARLQPKTGWGWGAFAWCKGLLWKVNIKCLTPMQYFGANGEGEWVT